MQNKITELPKENALYGSKTKKSTEQEASDTNTTATASTSPSSIFHTNDLRSKQETPVARVNENTKKKKNQHTPGSIGCRIFTNSRNCRGGGSDGEKARCYIFIRFIYYHS